MNNMQSALTARYTSFSPCSKLVQLDADELQTSISIVQ